MSTKFFFVFKASLLKFFDSFIFSSFFSKVFLFVYFFLSAEKINLQGSRNVLSGCLQSNVVALGKTFRNYFQLKKVCSFESRFLSHISVGKNWREGAGPLPSQKFRIGVKKYLQFLTNLNGRQM